MFTTGVHGWLGDEGRGEKMKRQLAIFAGVWICLGLAFGMPVDNALGRTVTDMLGRTVTVPPKAQRLVTTFKPASLCVAALGLQGRLVAIDTDSKRDRLQLAVYPAIAELPAVGQKSTGLNFETILAADPDLVILFAQKDGIAIADRLMAHGVAAIVILPEKMQSLYASLRLIADAAGVPDKAEHAIAACRQVLDLAAQRVASIKMADRRRVYFASAKGTFSTATGDLLQDEIIRMAGGINVGHALSGYFREISPEQFIAWNPDVVITSGLAARRTRSILQQPQFAGVSAVAAGRIYRFPSTIAPWDFPSPLSALGVLWLAKSCYPERFSDVDLNAEIDHFHMALFGKDFKSLGGKLDE
jgi:iron complex transport system substrate-binding protein